MGDSKAIGEVVWHDLMSLDADASRNFFTQLFGWTIEEWKMPTGDVYQMFNNGTRTFGGVMGLVKDDGLPSHWISYHLVDSVDDTCARATDIGGTIGVEPTDIPDVGRFAVIADPQGASFSVFADAGVDERDPDVPGTHGSITWHELLTSDAEAAGNFYARLFKCEIEVNEMDYGPYTILNSGNKMLAGIGKKPDEMPVAAWGIYFETEDIDDTLADISRLGGQVLNGPMNMPDIGKLGWATDPAGTNFAVMQSAPQE